MNSEKILNIDKAKVSPAFNGTYSFCNKCRKSLNCCVRVVPNGRISAPILFREDIERIEQYTGHNRRNFSIANHELKHATRIMKFNPQGCRFCYNGNCLIYAVRPLDCRLFPIDIVEKSKGSFAWIVYTGVCPIAFDVVECLEQAKNLLPQLIDKVSDYANADSPWMLGEPYIELDPVGITF